MKTFDIIVIMFTTILVSIYLFGAIGSMPFEEKEKEQERIEDYAERYKILLFLLFVYCLGVMGTHGDFIGSALTIDVWVIGCKCYLLYKERKEN